LHLYVPTVALLLLFVANPQSDSEKLLQFKAEAERATHKKIVIEEVTDDTHFAGATKCDDPKVIRIEIGHDITGDARTGVVAHELGHAITCGKLGVTEWRRPFLAPPPISQELLRDARNTVGGCAIEKAADREALKRGFNLEPRDAMTKANFAKWSTVELQSVYRRNGVIYANVTALQQFCFEYRDASYKNSPLETRILAAIPGSRQIMVSLRKDVTIHDCKTAIECFTATKQVRNAAGLDRYFLLVNPISGEAE